MKYKSDLKSAVFRAKASPRALFKGYNICIAAHVQTPAKTLSAIVRSAGGNVSPLLFLQKFKFKQTLKLLHLPFPII